MQKEVREAFRVQFKWSVLRYAKVCRTDAKAYRDFDVPKSTFYGWKRAYEKLGMFISSLVLCQKATSILSRYIG